MEFVICYLSDLYYSTGNSTVNRKKRGPFQKEEILYDGLFYVWQVNAIGFRDWAC